MMKNESSKVFIDSIENNKNKRKLEIFPGIKKNFFPEETKCCDKWLVQM
jgi:hypothetical protein